MSGLRLPRTTSLNRRLWAAEGEEGDYLIEEGAPLYADCHLLARPSLVACDDLREACSHELRLPEGEEGGIWLAQDEVAE